MNVGPIAYNAGDATGTNCDLEVNSDKDEAESEAKAETEAELEADAVHHGSVGRQGLMEVQLIFGATIATLIGKVSPPLNSFHNDFISPPVLTIFLICMKLL